LREKSHAGPTGLFGSVLALLALLALLSLGMEAALVTLPRDYYG
jgi:hypothetical protein